MKSAPAFAALAFMIAPGAALAQQASGLAGIFNYADTNTDGVVTRTEYEAANTARFTELDDNRDGALSAAERPTLPSGAPTNPLAAGGLTRAEFETSQARLFARLDRNGDGQIVADEVPGGAQ